MSLPGGPQVNKFEQVSNVDHQMSVAGSRSQVWCLRGCPTIWPIWWYILMLHTPPHLRRTDRLPWKHYLPVTLFAGAKNYNIVAYSAIVETQFTSMNRMYHESITDLTWAFGEVCNFASQHWYSLWSIKKSSLLTIKIQSYRLQCINSTLLEEYNE